MKILVVDDSNQKIYDILLKLKERANRKKFVIIDSQKDKRFLNEHVYKNLEKVYNKDKE